MGVKSRSLASLAANSGFGMADVAFLSGLEESTVCRLWDSPEWLDRVKGSSLQAIIQVIPGAGEYILHYSLAERRARLGEQLQDSGVDIDRESFKNIVGLRKIPEQYLCNALQAASYVLSGDAKMAASHLARFWGRDQDRALTLAYGQHPDKRLLVDASPLITASVEMFEKLTSRRNSFHALVAQANLLHHVARATGQTLENSEVTALERRSALAYRSSIMGRIITSNDIDLARIYCHSASESPLISLIEEWAFPTFAGDIRTTSDFSLPKSLLLRRTADEIISEVVEYNDAYLYYLTSTAIPAVVHRDPTFGLKLDTLRSFLTQRIDTTTEPAARKACARLLADIEPRNVARKEVHVDASW